MATFRYQLLLRFALALACGVLWMATPLCLDWIEVLTGWDLDQHNGSVERLISGAFLVLTAILLLSAAVETRRRLKAAAAPP